MECLYIPELTEFTEFILVENQEFKHIKALRLKEGDLILASNGKGYIFELKLLEFQKDSANFIILRKNQNLGELTNKLSLCIGILSDRTRFEFAIEKAVELGVYEIFPLITDYCEKKSISSERLQLKMIAALKQSKRSCLTKIHHPVKMINILQRINHYKHLIIADIEGFKAEEIDIKGDTIVFIGPEGGFSRKELDFLKTQNNLTLLTLGNRRLRTETAAISALSIISHKLPK